MPDKYSGCQIFRLLNQHCKKIMNKFIKQILTTGVFTLSTFTLADGDTINPVRLDKTTLSGLNLEPVTASWAPPERELFNKVVYSGDKFDVSVWAGNSAKTQIKNMEYDEFVYVINGQATLTTQGGISNTFHTGDFFVVPKGFSGEWHSQGNRFYQELIVIAKERAGNIGTSTEPFLIDKTQLSGLSLPRIEWPPAPEREVYREAIYSGPELSVAIVAGATAATQIPNMTEEFVYVLNGTAEITPEGGESQIFYTGDFFVVPEGFKGTWTSTGNNLYRELIVVPTKR